jgi:hypothetical protein
LASFNAVQAVGKSVERFLQMSFKEDEPLGSGLNAKKTKALLIRTEDFDAPRQFTTPALTIFLYRIDLNRMMRPPTSALGYVDGRGHLPLDLHFLVTAWGDNPEDEYRIIGRTMQAFETTPILSGPLLHEPADWAPNENVQVVMDELSTEAIMRTFDSLTADYKLSVPYVARVLRIDTRIVAIDPPVATQISGVAPSSRP